MDSRKVAQLQARQQEQAKRAREAVEDLFSEVVVTTRSGRTREFKNVTQAVVASRDGNTVLRVQDPVTKDITIFPWDVVEEMYASPARVQPA